MSELTAAQIDALHEAVYMSGGNPNFALWRVSDDRYKVVELGVTRVINKSEASAVMSRWFGFSVLED